jgi:radical SAM superfamily enzyme YgiQ (UPF0313 family)
MSFIPRLAPMVLAAVTPPEHKLTFLDEEIEELDFKKVKADIIGIMAMSVQAVRAYYLADEFRRRGYTVVIGGIHASSCPDEAMEHVDAVFIGESENSWPAMLEDFKNGRLKKRYDVKDYPPITKLASPKIDVVRHSSYSVLPLQATKGCPYNCDFCCIEFSSGHRYRMKPVEQVVEEIKAYEKLNKRLPKKRYHFNDDNLYVNRDYTIKLFKAIAKLNIQWMGMGSINTIKDDEVIKLMAESGCRNFNVGFESISEENLKQMTKVANSADEFYTASQKLISHGIVPGGYFIFGFDNDDEGSFRRTIDFTIKNHIINPYFQIMTPFPGTQVHERLKDRIFDKLWSHYGSQKCVFYPIKLSPKQLEAGLYSSTGETTNLDTIKEHLKYFWSHGPWKTNPRLTMMERILLRLLALVIWKKEEYREFLLWAAKQPDAVDMYQIVSAVAFNDICKKVERELELVKEEMRLETPQPEQIQQSVI